MQRLSFVVGSALLLSGCIFKQETPAVQMGALIASRYVHRGMLENEKGVIQPELNIDAKTIDGGLFTTNAWANLDLTNNTGDAWLPDGSAFNASEVDLTAMYSRSFGILGLAGGVTEYVLPNGSEFPNGARGTTAEIFATTSLNLFAGKMYSFVPVASAFYDVDESYGWYLNGGVQKGIPIPWIDDLRSEVAATIGWSDRKHAEWTYGIRESGFADLQGSLRLLYDLDENTTVSAGVAGSALLDDDIRDWVDLIGIDRDNVWVSFGISWSWL